VKAQRLFAIVFFTHSGIYYCINVNSFDLSTVISDEYMNMKINTSRHLTLQLHVHYLLLLILLANSWIEESDAKSSLWQSTLRLQVSSIIDAQTVSHSSMLRQPRITRAPPQTNHNKHIITLVNVHAVRYKCIQSINQSMKTHSTICCNQIRGDTVN